MEEPSAVEGGVDCVVRLITGDWSQLYEDCGFVIVAVSLLLFIWKATYYFLKLSSCASSRSIHNRPADGAGESLDEVQNDPNRNVANLEMEHPIAGEPEGEVQTARGADYRAAGDGWEGEDDGEYIIDGDLIVGNYSDESDEEAAILRRIILGAAINHYPDPILEEVQEDTNETEQAPLNENNTAQLPTNTEQTPHPVVSFPDYIVDENDSEIDYVNSFPSESNANISADEETQNNNTDTNAI